MPTTASMIGKTAESLARRVRSVQTHVDATMSERPFVAQDGARLARTMLRTIRADLDAMAETELNVAERRALHKVADLVELEDRVMEQLSDDEYDAFMAGRAKLARSLPDD